MASKFSVFWRSGLHYAGEIKAVYSVISYQTDENKTVTLNVKNNKRKHSEERAITQLRQLLVKKSLPSQTIKWFINFSPCHKCSDKIVNFIEEAEREYNITIEIDMKFCHLYKIRRPSCTEKCCAHQDGITNGDHGDNLDGLKMLEENGVTLQTFTREDWRQLADQLDHHNDKRVYNYTTTSRCKEDKLMSRDFQLLMSDGRFSFQML
jgi:hypothetical protein